MGSPEGTPFGGIPPSHEFSMFIYFRVKLIRVVILVILHSEMGIISIECVHDRTLAERAKSVF